MISKYLVIVFLVSSLSGCAKSDACVRLIEDAKDSSKIGLLKSWFAELSIDPEKMRSLGFAQGAIHNNGIKAVGLDLSAFGIPKHLASLDFYSEAKISYKDFKPELFSSLSIGYGMRELLLLKVNKSDTFGLEGIEEFHKYTTVVSDEVIVMCR